MARTKGKSEYQYSAREQFELYLVRHEELYNSRLLRNGFSPSFSINWNHLKGLNVMNAEPDEEDLRSYLTTYRKFVSEESPIFIQKIFNLCHQFLLSDNLKNELIVARKSWTSQLKTGFMNLNYNGKDISPEYVCDLWLNGLYFHDDLDKFRKLQSVRPFPLDYTMIRHMFLDHICQTTKYILFVGYIIKIAFREGLFDANI